MKIKEQKPKKSLNIAFLKVKPNRTDIERFKANLIQLLDRKNDTESEEFHKNLVSDFLKKTYYDPAYFINTKGRKDLVIHNGNNAASPVGVILEAKKPTNKAEMVTTEKLNTKAFHELMLYYLEERITHKNLELKHLVITNINEWFIFDATLFERLFADNKTLIKQFNEFEGQRLSGIKTDFFYKQIAEPFLETIQEIEFTYFDIRDYNNSLRNSNKSDDNKLIALFKLLSPEHLLKLPFANDSNSLDKRFYTELLHIIGLSETKEGSKKLIGRNKEGQRNSGSILEDTIIQLDSLDKISRLDNPNHFGATNDERLFSIALELSITWINRILFLKLLEAQMISYHKGDESFSFLNFNKIKNFDDLNSLFFQVLARRSDERNADVKQAFQKVPYLNSSLFEPTEIEQQTLFISNLKDDKTLPILSSTVLKNEQGKKRTGNLTTLQYLFEFLNAYDFSSEGSEEIQEDNKTLINASVLGLIFEKINGYKEGSFFTPGFITMYMCHETIGKAVIQKFSEYCLNEKSGLNQDLQDDRIDRMEDVYDLIPKHISRKKANEIINSIKICDPAVGSGHFLVSALNEMIAVKSYLKILEDKTGKSLNRYEIQVVNDELIITDEDGDFFEYHSENAESQRVQETLFHEKQTIIENCLFGVDINPNSVKICRLRLWIELLKNAYYKNATELETLPNIDININCGNSLVSRFAIDADLSQALKKSKWTIDSYRVAVDTYRNAENKEQKREMERLIKDIKNDFVSELSFRNKEAKSVVRLRGEVVNIASEINRRQAFREEIPAKMFASLEKAVQKRDEAEKKIQEIEDNKVFENAFEWRFEFPEVLDDDGNFIGFDVVIGNPPYVLSRETFDTSLKSYFSNNFKLIHEKPNLYLLFVEKSVQILNENGRLNLIIPNSITGVESAYKVRETLLKNHQIISIINLLGETFEGVNVESCILLVEKKAGNKKIKYTSIKSGNIVGDYFVSIDPVIWKNNRNFLFDVSSSDEEYIVIAKIKSNSQLLSNQYDVRVGLQAYEKGKGKPKQTVEDVKNHIFDYDYKHDRSTYPYLNGSDVGRYKLNWSGQWLKYGEWLSQPKIFTQFSSPRILIREITGKFPFVLQCTYTEETYLNNKSVLNVLQKNEQYDLKFLLAVLNSKLMSFYHKRQTVKGNRNMFPKIVIKDLKNYPIPSASESTQKIAIKFVDKIISLKKENQEAHTKELESEIDKLVYELYDLTIEEIAIVENGSK